VVGDPEPVDLRPVGRTEIHENELVAAGPDLGVVAGHLGVLQHDLTVRQPTQTHRLIIKGEPGAVGQHDGAGTDPAGTGQKLGVDTELSDPQAVVSDHGDRHRSGEHVALVTGVGPGGVSELRLELGADALERLGVLGGDRHGEVVRHHGASPDVDTAADVHFARHAATQLDGAHPGTEHPREHPLHEVLEASFESADAHAPSLPTIQPWDRGDRSRRTQSQHESRQPHALHRSCACSGAIFPPHSGHSPKVPNGERAHEGGTAVSAGRNGRVSGEPVGAAVWDASMGAMVGTRDRRRVECQTRVMPAPDEVVFDPDQVSAEWLGEVLVGAGEATGTLNGLAGVHIGAGKVGDNVRFTLDWSPAGSGPATVVGKFPSPDPMSRAAGAALGNYEREVRFYELLADTVAVRAPRCHLAHLDPATGDFVLILDDLAPAEVGDQITGCSVEEATAAVSELVALHAPRWGDPRLDDHRAWLGPRLVGGGQALADAWHMMLPGFLARYEGRIDPQAVAMATRFSESVGRWVDLSPGDPTVTHNDYRLDNILFGVDEDGTYAAVVDWQTVGTGPGIADVSYFIGAGLVPELRREVERDLVERYVTLLAATGIDTDPDDMWDAYRLTCPAGLVMAVFASTVVAPGERSDDMFLAMAERHALQMADLGVPAMLEAM